MASRSVSRSPTRTAILILSFRRRAVHHFCIRVAEEQEHPVGIARPPVALVTIEHDGRVAGDPDFASQLLETRPVQVVPPQLVVEVRGPVDLDGASDVAGGVEELVQTSKLSYLMHILY